MYTYIYVLKLVCLQEQATAPELFIWTCYGCIEKEHKQLLNYITSLNTTTEHSMDEIWIRFEPQNVNRVRHKLIVNIGTRSTFKLNLKRCKVASGARQSTDSAQKMLFIT